MICAAATGLTPAKRLLPETEGAGHAKAYYKNYFKNLLTAAMDHRVSMGCGKSALLDRIFLVIPISGDAPKQWSDMDPERFKTEVLTTRRLLIAGNPRDFTLYKHEILDPYQENIEAAWCLDFMGEFPALSHYLHQMDHDEHFLQTQEMREAILNDFVETLTDIVRTKHMNDGPRVIIRLYDPNDFNEKRTFAHFMWDLIQGDSVNVSKE